MNDVPSVGLSSPEMRRTGQDTVVIGVVNNMPDSALQTTERQFRELVSAVSESQSVRLRFFSVPEVPRGDIARAYINEHYEDVATLRESPVDGLIVTGTEPRTSVLPDEPYWDALTELVDWAEDHTASTIWSCLAAHAAVDHLDGIVRQRYHQKLSGVFECAKAVEHDIVAGMPARWRIPHSRQNTLPEDALIANGYQILSTSREAGVDMFAKQRNSLFLFVQGHPEYDPAALLREYQRDIARFLAGKRETYPETPRDYFDGDTTIALDAFRQKALVARDPSLLNDFPAARAADHLAQPWRAPAVRIYANWLLHLLTHRATAASIQNRARAVQDARLGVQADRSP